MTTKIKISGSRFKIQTIGAAVQNLSYFAESNNYYWIKKGRIVTIVFSEQSNPISINRTNASFYNLFLATTLQYLFYGTATLPTAMTKHPNRFPSRTIVAATAYCCFLASTTTAFVTPSSLSPASFVGSKTATAARNPILPQFLSFERTTSVSTYAKGRARSAATSLSSSTTSSSQLTSDQKSILSVGLWCVLDVTFRRLFQRLDIASKFPSSLGGCGVVLAVLLLASKASSSTKESKLHRLLSPGAALLAKWLPVFFVPSLVTLPLVGGIESLGGSTEVRIAV